MIQHLRLRGLLPLSFTVFTPLALAQAPMTVGNLVVLRFGDGVATLNNAACASFLEEWDPAGTFTTPVQPEIAIPTAALGAQFACTNSGSANSEGQLNLSTNGLPRPGGGAGGGPGTAAAGAADTPPVARVIGRFEVFTGAIDTSTAITDAYDPNPTTTGSVNGNIRAVVSDDGFRFWTTSPIFNVSGGGVRYVANLGDLTSTTIAPGNIRHIQIFHGDLYVSQASGSTQGIAQVGFGGLPTGIESLNLLNGFPTASGPSPYDMFWADPQTVYLADDQTGGAGGIQKWVLGAVTPGTWTKVYTLALGPSSGCRGVTGRVIGGVAELYAIANSGSQTDIVAGTDVVANLAGPAPALTSLRTAPANTAYRGIRFLSQPPNATNVPMACGTAELVVTGNAVQGSQVFTKMRNTQGILSLIALDATFTGIPLNLVFANCNCTLGVSPAPVLLPQGPAFTLTLSPSWATLGTQVFVQGLDLFTPAGVCPDLLDLTTTDTWTFSVQ